jgi:D-glycero-alpha-D-manno-heptose-7-phosphate kinase
VKVGRKVVFVFVISLILLEATLVKVRASVDADGVQGGRAKVLIIGDSVFDAFDHVESARELIGKQDQYAAAFGGLNFYEFRKDGRVRVESLWNSRNDTQSIFDSSILFWTGVQRKAEDILIEQQKNIPDRIDSLIDMSRLAIRCRDVILNSENHVSEIGEIINTSWVHKRNFASTISSDLLDDGVARAINSGAIGSKIAGAGGGGFLYVLAKKEDQENVARSLSDMSPVSFKYSPFGARVLISI